MPLSLTKSAWGTIRGARLNGSGEIGHESLQVAVVHPDERRLQLEDTIQVVNFVISIKASIPSSLA